jgi:PAS domain S-box-containing protein
MKTHLSLATKVNRGLLLMAGIFVLSAFLANNKLQAVRDLLIHLDTSSLPVLIGSYEMEINVNETGLAVKRYLHDPTPELLERLDDSEADFHNAHALYTKNSQPAELDVEVLAKYATYVATARQLVAARDKSTDWRPSPHEMTQFFAQRDALDELLDEQIQRLAQRAVVDAHAATFHNAETLYRLLVVLFGISVIAISAIAIYLVRGLHGPLNALASATTAIAQGNLARRVEVTTRDEIGALGESFNVMAEQLQENTVARSYLDSILAALSEAMWVVKADGVIERANPAAAALLGRDTAGMLDKHLPQVIGATAAKAFDAARQTGVTTRVEGTLFGPRGTDTTAIVAVSPMNELPDAVSRFVCTATDISDLKRIESELQASRDQLAELYRLLAQSQEQERTGLARDIHDEFGSILTLLTSTAHQLAAAEGPMSPAQRNLLAQLHDLVDSALVVMDRIVNDLRPPLLDHFGLGAAAQEWIKAFERRSGIRCSLRLPPLEPALSNELTLILFRALQEGLSNVLRHAHATQVFITLEDTGTHITLSISDNGRNGHAAPARAQGGLGLRGMRERAGYYGGTVEFNSSEKEGSRLCVRLPYEPQTDAARSP